MAGRFEKQKSLTSIPKSRYDVIVAKLKGTFNVPVYQRTPDQKKALYLFRKRHDFVLNEDQLLCHGKVVICEEDLPNHVKHVFKESHGCGPRVLYYKLKEKYTGFSEQNIIDILSEKRYYHKQYPRFRNKPIPKPVSTDAPGQRWQIDVINMRYFQVAYKNETYRYILQIIDIYSRYIIPQPLKSKSSKHVSQALEKALMEHGAPHIIQCDNGMEFKGREMTELIQKYNIKMIHGRLYHPQSQGKAERSNQELRKRIRAASSQKSGFIWVEGLSNIAFEINTSVKRILGNLTPFQAYHGRSHSGSRSQSISKNEMNKRIRKAKYKYTNKLTSQAPAPSKYKIKEKVLVRYPFSKTRVPTKRHIINGIILGVNKTGNRYHVAYHKPVSREVKRDWVGVENITSLTIKSEKLKRMTMQKTPKKQSSTRQKKSSSKKRYYYVLTRADQRSRLTQQHGVSLLFDPDPDGNCQFEALSHQLNLLGRHRDALTLRKEAVAHIGKRRTFYQPFIHDMTFDEYISSMEKPGKYGDNLTLLAITREYNLQALVISSRGPEFSSVVSNDGRFDAGLHTLALGYLPESSGMHYMSISIEARLAQDIIDRNYEYTSELFSNNQTIETDPVTMSNQFNQDSNNARSPRDPESNASELNNDGCDTRSQQDPVSTTSELNDDGKDPRSKKDPENNANELNDDSSDTRSQKDPVKNDSELDENDNDSRSEKDPENNDSELDDEGSDTRSKKDPENNAN